MKISIGIMLWNEEKSIEMTIDSLFDQSLFNEQLDWITSIQVLALANGCTDNSIPLAQKCFQKHMVRLSGFNIEAKVIELGKRGKTNAWNTFVHELTPKDAKYIFFMDADVYINQKKSLENMVWGLESHSECHVASALGIKDLELSGKMNFFERLTLQMTRLEQNARLTYLCGGLYAGRATFFRNFIFPDGFICGEDGFIATLAITNFGTTDFQFHRVYITPDASFVFEAYSSLPILFRQHVRRAIGAVVRAMIIDYTKREMKREGDNIGTIILQESARDPEWLLKYQETEFNRIGFWVIPLTKLKDRFTQLRNKSFSYKIKKIPIVLLGTIWLAGVVLAANRKIYRREHLSVWLSNPNRRMTSKALESPKEESTCR